MEPLQHICKGPFSKKSNIYRFQQLGPGIGGGGIIQPNTDAIHWGIDGKVAAGFGEEDDN